MKNMHYVALLSLLLVSACVKSSTAEATSVVTDSDGNNVEAVTPLSDRTLSIVFAGDAMQHKGQLASARRSSGEYDYSGYFDRVKPYINSGDYSVINFETTLAESDFTGYPMFKSPHSYAQAVKDAGFDLFLTANNHCLDGRDAGLVHTLDVLDEMGVSHIGTYRNLVERNKSVPMIADINGFKVAFLVYTYGTNGVKIQRDVVVDYIDRNKIKQDIAAAREAGAELIVVSVHWGTEYRLLPDQSQTSLADFLVKEGVDVINGGHPHVIQPMEVRHNDRYDKDVLVIYSLGNFVSDMRKTDTQGGAMAKARFKRDADGRSVFDSAEYLPVFVERGVPGSTNHSLWIADSVPPGPLRPKAKAFLDNAYGIFNKHNVKVPRSAEF